MNISFLAVTSRIRSETESSKMEKNMTEGCKITHKPLRFCLCYRRSIELDSKADLGTKVSTG